MSNWLSENIAKIATAWQAAFLFTVWLYQSLTGMGIDIVNSTGALALLAMSFIFTAYLFTITKFYKKQDRIIDATPQELFGIKQAIQKVLEPFGMKADIRLIPTEAPVEAVQEHECMVSREEFNDLKSILLKIVEDRAESG